MPCGIPPCPKSINGLSPIARNFFPEIFSWICEHANKPNQAENIVSLKYPLSAKYFLHKRRLPIRLNSRVPREELTKTEVAALDGLYGEFEIWCKDLGISPAKLI